jgi:hypothetical protein
MSVYQKQPLRTRLSLTVSCTQGYTHADVCGAQERSLPIAVEAPAWGKGEPAMDSRTKHDFWIMTVSTLATVVVAAIALAVLGQLH